MPSSTFSEYIEELHDATMMQFALLVCKIYALELLLVDDADEDPEDDAAPEVDLAPPPLSPEEDVVDLPPSATFR